MKKICALALVLVTMFAVSGCGKTEPEQPLMVYSFHGENEQLKVTNGVIVLSDGKDVFYGGDLEINEDFPSNITSFSTTFYVASENKDNTIWSNSVVDQTGSCIQVGGDLGKISGEGGVLGTVVDEEQVADLKNNLFFELTTTDTNGEENVYQIQMLVSEVMTESER